MKKGVKVLNVFIALVLFFILMSYKVSFV